MLANTRSCHCLNAILPSIRGRLLAGTHGQHYHHAVLQQAGWSGVLGPVSRGFASWSPIACRNARADELRRRHLADQKWGQESLISSESLG